MFGLCLSLLAGHWLSGPVVGDGLSRGQVLVAGDHIDPGATFTVSGYDLDEDAAVRIELVAGDTRLELGSTTTASDGTLDADVVLPRSFPTGYADLHVIATGASWSTSVLVGERAEGVSGASGTDLDTGFLVVAAVISTLLMLAAVRLARANRIHP